jgi:hypothetical protein
LLMTVSIPDTEVLSLMKTRESGFHSSVLRNFRLCMLDVAKRDGRLRIELRMRGLRSLWKTRECEKSLLQIY